MRLTRLLCALGAAALASAVPGLSQPPSGVFVVLGLGGNRNEFLLTADSQDGVPLTAAEADRTKMRLALVDADDRVVADRFSSGAAAVTPIPGGRTQLTIPWRLASEPPPGLYTLVARFDELAFHRAQQPLAAEARPLKLFVAPPAEKPPALVAGQRFLDAAAGLNATGEAPIADPPLEDSTGTAVERSRIGLKPLTLVTIDSRLTPHRLSFSVEGVGVVTMRSSADVSHLPGLMPLVSDIESRALDRTYAGKPAWTIGSASLHCIASGKQEAWGSVDSDAQAFVQGVYRAYDLPTEFPAIGRSQGTDFGEPLAVQSPLVVALAVPATTNFAGGSFSTPATPGAPLKPVLTAFDFHADCSGYSLRFAGAWDFERGLSASSMESAHADWSPALLEHIRKREVRVGMSHEAIAWIFGYPPVYGTAQQLRNLETWYYREPAPFTFSVYFTGDEVSRFDPPGRLP